MLRLAASLLFAVSLFAQNGRITLEPAAPTSLTPIEAHVFVVCREASHTVTRAGNVIKIHIQPGPDLCDPPIPSMTRVSIGTLPAGEYRIEVMVGQLDSIAASRLFVVRDGVKRDAAIHPFTVRTQAFGLMLRLAVRDKIGIPRVWIGDAEVPQSSITFRNDLYEFPAPAHARGLVDVKYQIQDAAPVTLPGALYYFDHNEPLDTSVFERILFPVLFHGAGAHGSEWVSDAAIANRQLWDIETYNDVFPYVCLGYPCGERLSPNSSHPFPGSGFPRGVALIAPRGESEHLTFSLRVRDTAVQDEGYGTQVPVVREREMFRNTDLTLLDVPIDPRYRAKLRMYVFDSGEHEAHVIVDHDAPATPNEEFVVPVRRTCSGFDCEAIPWYAELDLPSGAIGERANVYVSIGGADTPAWAFASITNNETQQVTIVTADGDGGRP